MLISAMDNVGDNKCTNNADSNESNSVTNISESDERDSENFESDEVEDELEIDQGSTNPTQKCFPGTDILQEIDMTEIKFLKAIGKGSFGVVHKAIWKGRTVAVKKVETDTEVTAFLNEIKQLSRVRHENIIQMYGTGTSLHAKCIIMEFANDGSLYQFLHCPPHQKYNLSHALSWLLQCARAIAYLHSIEPRPIIHRDLKPLNMLLTNGKKVLKICDFGTACDLRSVMTDNKGSTAWMAPEVIKGSNYNEKCDVYSWGMILWELLTRRVPFEELGQTYRIIWQVVNNTRPPLIQGCPKPIERLMKRCWLDEQSERPSMQDVVDIVYPLYKVVNDGEEAVGSFSSSGEFSTESCVSPLNGESSAGHTSRDVSEIASSSTNTNDLPENVKNKPYVVGVFSGQEGAVVEDEHEEYSKFQLSPQSQISPNASASVLVGVENLLPPWGSAKSDDVYTPFSYRSATPLTVTPKKPTSLGEGMIKHQPPPEMLTPLSISIPNDGANNIPEANFILEPVVVDPSFSPWTFLTPSSHSSQSVSSASSPTVTFLPRTVINTPQQPPFYLLPSQQRTSPPLTSVATTLTLAPVITSSVSSPVEKNSSSTLQVPFRRAKMSNDPSAAVRRRSAGDPQHNRSSIVPSRGHRRASSYESSELIGFEPLADEVLREQQQQQQQQNQQPGVGQPPHYSEGLQWKNESVPSHDFWQHGASRINEEVDCPLKGNSDERARGTVHFSVSPYYQRVNHPSSGVSGNKGLASASGHQNQDSSPKLVSPTSPYKRVSYKGAGGFPPESAALSPPKSKGVGATAVTTESDELGSYWQLLDDDLKPTMPQPSCPHSQQIFNEHNELAHQLLVVQEEIVYLDKKKSQMLKKLEDQDRDQQACRQRYSDKISQLKNKNESLRHDHSRLSHQLEEIRSRRQKGHHQQQQQQQSMQNQSSQQQQQQLNNQRLFHHHHHQLSSSTHLSSSTSPSSQYPHLHIPNQPSPHHSHQSQPDHSQQHQYVPQRQQQQQTQQYYYDNHHLYPHYTQNQ